MATNSKRKGKTGELELAKTLKEMGLIDVRRSVQYNGKHPDGEADLIGVPGLHVECKRVEKLNISKAMNQSIQEAKNGEIPIVAHRKNREPWYVTLRLEDFIKMYKKGEY